VGLSTEHQKFDMEARPPYTTEECRLSLFNLNDHGVLMVVVGRFPASAPAGIKRPKNKSDGCSCGRDEIVLHIPFCVLGKFIMCMLPRARDPTRNGCRERQELGVIVVIE
jgi:hypothetical protein